MIKLPILFSHSYSFDKVIARHLDHTSTTVNEALAIRYLHYEDLALINPSCAPDKSLAYAIFQKILTIKNEEMKDRLLSNFINRLLAINF